MAILWMLWQNARRRRGAQRLIHAGFALCFVVAGCFSYPYIRWEVAEFDEMIQLAKKEQK